jgi:glycosyltransferase involved in cell wall biosynthesis
MPDFGFLSTYPPTQCGLATFTAALLRGLAPEGRMGVVRVVDAPVSSEAPEVVGHLYSRSRQGHREAASVLNAYDVAVVQHDFNIYGGVDGDQILSVIEDVRVPIITVLHTVLAEPNAGQRQVLEQLVSASAAVVTMSETAHVRLAAKYDIDPIKAVIIPHGAVSAPIDGTGAAGGRPLILTWGLLGPGKGIEWAIDALPALRNVHPRPAYIVAGQTHPRVRQEQGEAYRLHLSQRARAVGVADQVRFAASYLDQVALTRLVDRADVVLLPYDSREQACSGVLVEAIAAGKPVVATAFPHAVELLSGGAGIVVPQYDSSAIGAALHTVLTEPGRAEGMAAAARQLAPSLTWQTVAARYHELAMGLLSTGAPALR